jgi:hypothetical protein
MIIRTGGWPYPDDEPPQSQLLYRAALALATWIVVLVTLFVVLSWCWPSH